MWKVGGMTCIDTPDCDLCAKDDGNYSFDRDCCLVRFVLHVPTKTLRAGYLSWFVSKFGDKRAQHVKELVEKAWQERKLTNAKVRA
jgi:hypothetical protein